MNIIFCYIIINIGIFLLIFIMMIKGEKAIIMNVGLIGIGGFGKNHAKAIINLIKQGKLKCTAFADIKVKSDSNEYRKLINLGAKYYENFEEMLDSQKDLAFIVISTPIFLHKSMAITALCKGHNVLLEKPPAVTIQDIDELISIKQKTGKLCGVDFQNTSGKAFRTLVQKISKGELGTIKKVIGVGMWKRTQSYYDRTPWAGKLIFNGNYVLDGTLNNPFAHMINNCLILSGYGDAKKAQPKSVQAELYKGHDIEGEDTACIRVYIQNGIEIMVFTTLCNPINDIPYIEVYGSRGKAIWRYDNSLKVIYYNGKERNFNYGKEELIVNMYNNFIDALENGEDRLYSSIEDCRNFVLTTNGAFESCSNIIKIPDEHLIVKKENETIVTYIRDIDNIFNTASSYSKLFSELGVKWSTKTKVFAMYDYNNFELFTN